MTYFFLKGLQGEADHNKDGAVDLAELFDYVKPQVERKARRDFNTEQTLHLLGSPEVLARGVRLVERAVPSCRLLRRSARIRPAPFLATMATGSGSVVETRRLRAARRGLACHDLQPPPIRVDGDRLVSVADAHPRLKEFVHCHAPLRDGPSGSAVGPLVLPPFLPREGEPTVG